MFSTCFSTKLIMHSIFLAQTLHGGRLALAGSQMSMKEANIVLILSTVVKVVIDDKFILHDSVSHSGKCYTYNYNKY